MFKFNNGDGAIICDNCRTILIAPADEREFIKAPVFNGEGLAFCDQSCLDVYRAEQQEADEAGDL